MTKRSAKGVRRLRRAVAGGVLGIAAGALCFNVDLGTLCAWCPVGFAQASAAAQAFLPGMGVPLLAFAAVALATGRAFCAWGCPTSLLGKQTRPARRRSATKPVAARRAGRASRGRALMLLGGLLAVSFVVGFPVFCLFCPIGLAFGFLVALFKSFTIYQPSWDLVVFPALLFAEMRLLRSWCRLICPLGALFGLIGLLDPRRLRSRAPRKSCRQADGCPACEGACPGALAASAIKPTADEERALRPACTAARPPGASRVFDSAHSRVKGGTDEGSPHRDRTSMEP